MQVKNIVLLFVFLFFSLFAFASFVSTAVLEKAYVQVSKWSAQSPPTYKEISFLHSYLDLANALAANQSYKVEMTEGRLYQWQAYLLQLNQQEAASVVGFLQRAKEQYSLATKIAPNRFQSWLALISVKVALQEYDEEFQAAMASINRLKGENSLHYWEVTTILLPGWDGLPSGVKVELLKAILWQFETGSQYTKLLIDNLGTGKVQKVFCRYVKYSNSSVKTEVMTKINCSNN